MISRNGGSSHRLHENDRHALTRQVMKGGDTMSEEKKAIIERIATKFTAIETPEAKGYAVMCMTAYEAGREAGKVEEREQWEKKIAAIA